MGKFGPIGDRLREERERLGFNQTDFAEIGGAGRKTQYNYESGERVPDGEYLAEIATAGADVTYILTGQRAGVSVATPSLTPEQRRLFDLIDGLDEEGQRDAREALERERRHSLARRELAELRAAKGDRMTFHGPVGQTISGNMHVGTIKQTSRFK